MLYVVLRSYLWGSSYNRSVNNYTQRLEKLLKVIVTPAVRGQSLVLGILFELALMHFLGPCRGVHPQLYCAYRGSVIF